MKQSDRGNDRSNNQTSGLIKRMIPMLLLMCIAQIGLAQNAAPPADHVRPIAAAPEDPTIQPRAQESEQSIAPATIAKTVAQDQPVINEVEVAEMDEDPTLPIPDVIETPEIEIPGMAAEPGQERPARSTKKDE